MGRRSAVTPGERIASLAMVVAIYAGLVALLLIVQGPDQPASAKPGAITVVSLPAELPPSRTAPPPKLPSKIGEKSPRLPHFAASDQPDPMASAAPSEGCLTLEEIRASVLADPAALTSVHNAPFDTRSIADAVVLWNAGWSAAAASSDAPLGPARAAVEKILATEDEACLDEPIAGPRLIPIPAGQRTMFLVFGSGNWRWRDVESSPAQTDVPLDEMLDIDIGDGFRRLLERIGGN